MNLTPVICHSHSSTTSSLGSMLFWCHRGRHVIRLIRTPAPLPKAA